MPHGVPPPGIGLALMRSLAVSVAVSCGPQGILRPPDTAGSGPRRFAEFWQDPSLTPARLHARLSHLLTLPRGLGDPRRDASIDRLERALARAGARNVLRHPLAGRDPLTGQAFALANIYGHVRPQATRQFVLATHFDTRPWADEDPDVDARGRAVPGANDGTSGLAVVLSLVPVLAVRLPPDVGFSIALFDGEELGRPDQGGYCAGSRALAQALWRAHPTAATASADPLARSLAAFAGAQFGIVLDMVGDADLRLTPEPGSVEANPWLVDAIWAAAARRGHRAFDRTPRGTAIVDDHTFLSRAGVPSVLLLDAQYDAWHTTGDTMERTSGQSLAVVADTVVAMLLQHYGA